MMDANRDSNASFLREHDGGFREPETSSLLEVNATYAGDEYDYMYYESSSPKYDYSVLAVALITMGLIVPVEIVRHKIDHRAVGRPFAKTVLDFLYSELSTLGIVEFAIYLAQTYAREWDKDVKDVFAKVHFLMFFTAIINAFMSTLLALAACHVSNRIWVRTEELDLRDYIAIREQFDRVEAKIVHYKSGSPTDATTNRSSRDPLWKRIYRFLRHPLLQRQYYQLLLQVRFHELRVHFLESNGLPLKFRVSDYLVQSELKVLQKCVHISIFAWILIAAAVNLCYYLMGIIMHATGSQVVVGTTLTWIFIGGCISFVPISYAMYEKCSWIYAEIMKKELIDWNDGGSPDVSNGGGGNTSSDSDSDDVEAPPPRPSLSRSLSQSIRHYIHMPRMKSSSSKSSLRSRAIKQLDLFWFGDPGLVIGAFQFMQLGYSIAASTLLIFWDYIDVNYSSVGATGFILSLALCYLIFFYVMAQVIPRYTLCTSLGQLVNHRRVNETLAQYKLDEALRKKRRIDSDDRINKALSGESLNTVSSAATSHDLEQDPDFEKEPSSQIPNNDASAIPFSPTNPEILTPGLPAKPVKMFRRGSSVESSDSVKMAKLAELVQTRTADLPSLSPAIKKANRRSRKKAHSDGVALMANLKDADETVKGPPIEINQDTAKRSVDTATRTSPAHPAPVLRSGRYGPRVKSVSANVALMQSPASSMYAMPSAIALFASEEKEEESAPPLPPLLEGIPARSVDPSELVVPVGRTSSENSPAEMSTSTKVVRVIEPTPDPNDKDVENDQTSHQSESTNSTLGSDGHIVHFGPKSRQSFSTGTNGEKRSMSPVPSCKTIIRFLKSQTYRLISGVFGTMLVFFVIGMRIEAFLIETGTMPDSENTWHLRNLSASFWWILAWFSTFVAMSLASSVIFFLDCKENDSLHLLYASVFDVVLSSICLSLLILSEGRRCCDTGADCCAAFGSRTFGGLGNTEPFIALIALRVFRYQLGRVVRKLVKTTYRKKSETASVGDYCDVKTKSTRVRQIELIEENTGKNVALADDHDDASSAHNDSHNSHDKEKHNFGHETGTAVELWKNAVGLFPEIVKEHGEFSEELLKAMLGISSH